MEKRGNLYFPLRILRSLFVLLWLCNRINFTDCQGIRGTVVNNRIVNSLGKVNFIYPTGYTTTKVIVCTVIYY